MRQQAAQVRISQSPALALPLPTRHPTLPSAGAALEVGRDADVQRGGAAAELAVAGAASPGRRAGCLHEGVSAHEMRMPFASSSPNDYATS